jgi:hypothetical protein
MGDERIKSQKPYALFNPECCQVGMMWSTILYNLLTGSKKYTFQGKWIVSIHNVIKFYHITFNMPHCNVRIK